MSAVVLAAGEGTRMRSDMPKVLHRIGGKPMLAHVLAALMQVSPSPQSVVVVVGKAAEQVEASARSNAPQQMRERLAFVTQHERLGTAHACAQARPLIANQAPTVLVLYGDVPLLQPNTVTGLLDRHDRTGATMTLLTAEVGNAAGYGRIVRRGNGDVDRIVEDKHATAEERRITEINAGVYAIDDSWLWPTLERLEPSSTGEIYLTDLVARAADEGRRVVGVVVDDPGEVAGVNTVDELSRLEAVLDANDRASGQRQPECGCNRGHC